MKTSDPINAMSMPQYQSHKKVWALKIKAVNSDRALNGSGVDHSLTFEDTRYAPRQVSPEYIQKHNPKAGGYFVVYEDGYESWSPAAAFESGYELMPGEVLEVPLTDARSEYLEIDPVTGLQKDPSTDARVTIHGTPMGEHLEIDPVTGMQKDYVVLSQEERAKEFIRPVRSSYEHLTCRTVTSMGNALAETYARDPGFYSGTYCATCKAHFPVGADGEFVWHGTTEKVGT